MDRIKMNRPRLKKLKELFQERLTKKGTVRKDARGKFNMNSYGEHPAGAHSPEEQNYCGTSMCVLGHAAVDPRFRNLKGFWTKSTFDTHDDPSWDMTIELPYEGTADGVLYDEWAGKEYFGLTDNEVSELFFNLEMQTERDVINKIDAILAREFRGKDHE